MTIDGKIATNTGDPELSDEEDWREVHKLRTQVDAIMVGKGTILKDDPKLHIKYYEHDGYFRIALDSNLEIPKTAKIITYKPDLYPTIICTTENASKEKIKSIEEKETIIVQAGKGHHVSLLKLMPLLKDRGINSVLLEGGGTLNWSFLKRDLIDEIRLTIAPWLIGGKNATSLVEGEGFKKMKLGIRYKLKNLQSRDNYVILHYIKREEKESE